MQNLLLRTSILLAMLTTAVGISLAAVEPDPDKGAVNGFIEDTTSKETLVGATVTVKGTKLGAYTNKSGYFSISNIPAGDQTIVISSIGYLRKELKVRIEAGSSVKLRVQMVQSKTTTKEVLVSAERAEDKRQISIS
ncbi:MAG: carboxypeptidase-like regulatory domain-containing protein, partial [Candidatus Kapabacteria bacterium]|nr:carboxypeptidase-like regulatory domain-containing protein [Candidatus Kapabacteria bacterium]